MRRPKRHQPSTIDRLPPEIRELIAKLRIDHGWTIDQILEKLLELDKPVSRSALGRHVRSIEEIGMEMRHSREMAKALAEQAAPDGKIDDAKVSDLNTELLHGLILRLVTATKKGPHGPEAVTFTPREVEQLSNALKSLASARKTDTDRLIKIEQAAFERGKRAVLDAVSAEVGKSGSGITAETVDFIRKAVLGGEG